MVDVSSKDVTKRSATAIGTIYINQHAYSLITGLEPTSLQAISTAKDGDKLTNEKLVKLDKQQPDESRLHAMDKAWRKAGGDGRNVLTIAQLAGIMGAKSTSNLIPLCHPLQLSHVHLSLVPTKETLGEENTKYAIRCEATVTCEGKTGVEMEALTSVSISLLTIWDMLKAVAGQEMAITDITLVQKVGGKSDFTR